MSTRDPACQSCGRQTSRGVALVAIEVRHKRTGERRDLRLCSGCAAASHAVWRLAWEPLHGEDCR